MTSTTFDPVPARLRARQATGYDPRFLSDELEQAPDEHSIFGAEGGLWSCVEDLARWLSCQFTGKTPSGKVLLSEATLKEMHKPRYLVDDAWTRAWAIGWYAVRKDDVVWRMHSGGHYGFITNACFEPGEKIGAIALLNGFANAPQLAMELGHDRTRGGDGGRAARRACSAASRRMAAADRSVRRRALRQRRPPRVARREAHVHRSRRPDVDTHARRDGRPRRLPDRAGLPRVGRARPLSRAARTAA